MPYIWTWVSQNDDTGINLLKRAIELDPGYARAHCLLAWIFASRVQLGTMDYERGISDGLTLAQRRDRPRSGRPMGPPGRRVCFHVRATHRTGG